jgi:Zn-dependent peptidase ImmA (M78 family)
MPVQGSDMPEVPVNGKVLQWARQVRGLSIDDAAPLLGISSDELREYESGAKRPLVTFLRLMSAQYQINFTSLLMPEPLPIEKRLTDHRERHGRNPLTIDTLVAMEEVNEFLEVFADIASESRRMVPVLNIGKATLDDDPEVVAARERRRFNVSIDEQRSWRGLDTARRQWRQRIEDRGVFTYMIKLQDPDELSGFSIYHDDLAAICVNDRESTEGAKIFTLFHEYCHLLLRQTGISDENNNNRVERFCNQFAASFLIPRQSLIDAIGDDIETPHEFSSGAVQRFARQFRVSNRAIALRLQETGLAPDGFYGRRTGPWDLPSAPVPISSERQPTYITLQLKRIGKLHAATALRAAKRHVINSFDASQLIGLQPASFPKLEAVLR